MTNLNDLAVKYGTDKKIPDGKKAKNGLFGHSYTPIYERLINEINPKSLLEIGISFGSSIRMWSEYLPDTKIVSFDISEKRAKLSDFKQENVSVYLGDQSDVTFLKTLKDEYDIIIDDGSHVLSHILISFAVLYDFLSDNGVYVIEDIHVNPNIEKHFQDCNYRIEGKLLLIFKNKLNNHLPSSL